MRGIRGFVIRRVLFGLVTLFVASIIIFAATQALPGNFGSSHLPRNRRQRNPLRLGVVMAKSRSAG